MGLPEQLHRIDFAFGQGYLWRDGDEVTLVDTGPAGSGPVVADALAGLGLERAAVVRIVLTHFHPDHAGSAAEIREWAGAEVVAHAADAPVIRGDVPEPALELLPAEVELVAALGIGGMPATPPCPVDREVADGDVLPFGGGARVVHGPGHTPGSIGLHLPEHRLVFTGDTVAESGGTAILGPFNLDRTGAVAAFRLLTGLDVDVALVGHGEPIPAAALRPDDLGPFADGLR